MRSKRILGVVSAIMMLGVCAVPAYADSEAEIPEYSADKSILTTDTSAPSLSLLSHSTVKKQESISTRLLMMTRICYDGNLYPCAFL